MVRLKTNKAFIKQLKKKINPKNNDQKNKYRKIEIERLN